MNHTSEITGLADILKADYKLSDFDALKIAAEITKVNILSEGLMINPDQIPVALEGIAMQLDDHFAKD